MQVAEVPNTGKGYKCDQCDSWYSETDFKTIDVIYEPERPGDEHYDVCCDAYFVANTGSPEVAWLCGGNCFHHDEGRGPDMERYPANYECGKCNSVYDSMDYDSPEEAKQEAVDCCSEDEETASISPGIATSSTIGGLDASAAAAAKALAEATGLSVDQVVAMIYQQRNITII